MRILYAYQGKATTFDRPLAAAVIGRPKPGITVDVDLSPDSTVSRPHARIWLENDRWWIQDLGSSGGTLVNGEEIRGEGKLPLPIGSHIRIGETELQFEPPRKPLGKPGAPAEKPRPYVRALDPNATQLTDFIKKVNI